MAGAYAVLTQLAKARLGLESRDSSTFQLIFSAQGFPGYHLQFENREEEYGGYWYTSKDKDWGWLCLATLHFFTNGHSENLYIRVCPIFDSRKIDAVSAKKKLDFLYLKYVL
ncbi:hypothetical protein [Synechocystis sp. FACHB-383]|uniref:hypothetical protein n=1 Tax=Synechocystis sp. FACHB-383 TaxID=2692864 RepID=UPI0018F01449|nr:hypothetical protein [Synechocystis sp. FACHB-383]